MSKVEVKMNRLVIYVVIAQQILCGIIAIVGSFWYRDYENEDYYLPFGYTTAVNGVITYFTFFLLLNTMLPISLIVSLEIVKVI
jgi:magnesium-transporting ATPase (P-type)